MKRASYRPLKPLGLLLLAALIAGVPSLASAHRDRDDDKVIVVVPERHKHYKSHKYYKRPRVTREYHYYQPYVIERYTRPLREHYYYYDYSPRRPYGNLNLSIDFPFVF